MQDSPTSIPAGRKYLGPRACLAIGAAIVFGHNLLDAVWSAGRTVGTPEPLWTVLHARQVYEVGPLSIYFSYPLLRGSASCSSATRQPVSFRDLRNCVTIG